MAAVHRPCHHRPRSGHMESIRCCSTMAHYCSSRLAWEGVAQYAYALHVEQYEGAFEQSAPEEHEHCPVNVIVAREVP